VVASVNRAEHRMTEAMMVSVEVFDELTAERNQSVAQAAASVRAEGLTISSDAEAIMERWARGELSTTQMRELVRKLYTS
jgi:Antitoxin VbhA